MHKKIYSIGKKLKMAYANKNSKSNQMDWDDISNTTAMEWMSVQVTKDGVTDSAVRSLLHILQSLLFYFCSCL